MPWGSGAPGSRRSPFAGMDRASESPQSPSPATAPVAEPTPALPAAPIVASNSWARRTILARSMLLGLPPDVARQVGSTGVWYYNRILLLLVKKGSTSRELSPSTNRYLVPISITLACDYHRRPLDLDRILRLSARPTKGTIRAAHEMYRAYARALGAARPRPTGAGPRPVAGAPVPAPSSLPTPPAFRVRTAGPPPGSPDRARPPAPAVPGDASTALALPLPPEIAGLRGVAADPPSKRPADRASGPRPHHHTTNAWARKRIADLCRNRGIPERIRGAALDLYNRIVDLHSARGRGAPKVRLELSPRLNWALVYTTIYLACRAEEYPKDLRAIMGDNLRPGSMREVYRLYRFYKRRLSLGITLLDVKTLILSWMDGFELGELLEEAIGSREADRLSQRAIALANRARADATLRNASTKMIAAGALTTALAERSPPGRLSTFYHAVASFLHMSESNIRLIVTMMARALRLEGPLGHP
jgi:hypothetical protein